MPQKPAPAAQCMPCVQEPFVDMNGALTCGFDGRIHIARCQIAWHSDHRSGDEAMLLCLPSGVVLKIKSLESVVVLTKWFTALNAIPKKKLVLRPNASVPQELEADFGDPLKNRWLSEAVGNCTGPNSIHCNCAMCFTKRRAVLFCPRGVLLESSLVAIGGS